MIQRVLAFKHVLCIGGRRAALALSLGAIYRMKGGMALLSTIGLAVDTLIAVGQASANPMLHMWVTHGLWLIANAAGLSYVPHVQVSLKP